MAKKSKPSKRIAGGGGGGGGFAAGKVTKEKAAVEEDYAIFPRLDRTVLDTIVPISESMQMQPPGELSGEIYDRLDQIYGFPNFNYLSRTKSSPSEEISLPSLSEIINAAPSSQLSSIDDLLQPQKESSQAPVSENSISNHLDKIPAFDQFRVLHVDPLVLSIDNFFTHEECDAYIAKCQQPDAMQSRSPTVGKDAAAKAQRTSTTWYHAYKDVPELMAKASRLLGLADINCWEEAQVVRYRRLEKFTWHLDALGPRENHYDNQKAGGQRIATLLVYLTELQDGEGGGTVFRDLVYGPGTNELSRQPMRLRMRPQKGSALLFFPAAGGIPNAPFDIRTLHCGEVVSNDAKQDKWISQLWLRQAPYTPTAPPGNKHASASQAISDYCAGFQ